MLQFVADPDDQAPSHSDAKATANLSNWRRVSYSIRPAELLRPGNDGTRSDPLLYVDKDSDRRTATAQAMLNDDGQVVRVVHGPVPLWGTRRGEDVMLTDVLAFDLRVFDPGAPIFRTRADRIRC